MKDSDMTPDTAGKAQASLEKTIRLFQKLEGESCSAAQDCDASAKANAAITSALGHLYLAKGLGTTACIEAPDVTANFGGK